jgi:lipid-A-disaccharide synthase-like uncharacterized protein
MKMSLDSKNDDGAIGATLWTVALAGAVITLCSPLIFGAGGVVSAGLGAGLAVGNLWAIGRLVRGLLGGNRGATWGPLGVLKLLVLFLVLYVLIRHDLAKVLPLAFGYLALPFGIVLSQLRAGSPARGEN